MPDAQQRAYMLLFEIERERAKKSEQRPKLGNANADKIPVLGALAIRRHIREQNKVSADPGGAKIPYKRNYTTLFSGPLLEWSVSLVALTSAKQFG